MRGTSESGINPRTKEGSGRAVDQMKMHDYINNPLATFEKAAAHLKTRMTETQGSIDFISRALKAPLERREVKL